MSHEVIDTSTLLELARAAERHDFNRQLDVEALEPDLDPKGFHVMYFRMLHNDSEWRTMWYVKLKDREDPIDVALDVSFEDWPEVEALSTKIKAAFESETSA